MNQLKTNPSGAELSTGLRDLEDNYYAGRIAIVGLNMDGNLALVATALTGRGPTSKDRTYIKEDDTDGAPVRAVAESKTPEEMARVADADLIYYRSQRSGNGLHVISNGAQTDPVYESMLGGGSLEEAFRTAPEVERGPDSAGRPQKPVKLSEFEPDDHYTPRILAAIDLREGAPTPFGIAIVRKNLDTGKPAYSIHEAESVTSLDPGVGYGIQTYKGNGDPLPSFDSDPYAYPMGIGPADTAAELWETLNPETRVAVAVRAIDLTTGDAVRTVIIDH